MGDLTTPQVVAVLGICGAAVAGAYKLGAHFEEMRGQSQLFALSKELHATKEAIKQRDADAKAATEKMAEAMKQVDSLTVRLAQSESFVADLNGRVNKNTGCVYFQQKINEIEKEMAYIREGRRYIGLSVRGFAGDGPEKAREEAAQRERDKVDLEQLQNRAIEYSKKADC